MFKTRKDREIEYLNKSLKTSFRQFDDLMSAYMALQRENRLLHAILAESLTNDVVEQLKERGLSDEDIETLRAYLP